METDGIFDAPQLIKYRDAVEVIDEVLKSNPTATALEIRQYASAKWRTAQTEVDAPEARTERGTCRHCEVGIVRGNNGAWFHGDVPSWGSRGCWSHSFQRLGIWDSPLDRSWSASPA